MSQEMDVNALKAESWRMFDEISPRYDFLNSILSFGCHSYFRRKMVDFLLPQSDQMVLDLATGTGDVLITLFTHSKKIIQGVGIDMAEKMIFIGRKKIEKRGLSDQVVLQTGDIRNISFMHRMFDLITLAFGIRNVPEPDQVLKEMYRVLKHGGRALVLEFSLPKNALIRKGHLFYLRTFVPFVGALFSGNHQAYRYLSQTIERFPSGEDFCRMMTNAGFQKVTAHPLLKGIATIYQGDKS